MTARPEVFVSLDTETDGPAPGLNSMLALGAAAFSEAGEELGTFYATLHPLPDTTANPETMTWWRTQPDAWAEVNRNRMEPANAMIWFAQWCEELTVKHEARAVAVGWPVAFDFAFVNYYCHRFAGRNPLGFGGIDIRSYANGLAGYPSCYGLPEKQVRAMAGPVDTDGLRDHVAVDDATGQGRLFMALRRGALARQEPDAPG